MRNLTAKEIAFHFRVEKRVAQGWIQRGLFPNAWKHLNPIFGKVWMVPETDLIGFAPPRQGRPPKANKELKAA